MKQIIYRVLVLFVIVAIWGIGFWTGRTIESITIKKRFLGKSEQYMSSVCGGCVVDFLLDKDDNLLP